MILAVDVFYKEGTARCVGVLFDKWESEEVHQVVIQTVDAVAEYEPGAFYKRELPCVLAVIAALDIEKLSCIVIDGYVWLNDEGKSGLGGYLYEAIQQKVPVIGVAKTTFANNHLHVRSIVRGESKNPLYITAIGVPLETAASCIESMAGTYRIPTLLKQLDQLTKSP